MVRAAGHGDKKYRCPLTVSMNATPIKLTEAEDFPSNNKIQDTRPPSSRPQDSLYLGVKPKLDFLPAT